MTDTEEAIEWLQMLVGRQTTADKPETVEATLDMVLAHCADFGMHTKKVGPLIGWAEAGDKNAPMWAILLHLDVVPAGNGWQHNPFVLMEEAGVLYGRGVYDNKGPAAMILTLVKQLLPAIKANHKRIRLIFGTREEEGMDDVSQYVATEEMPSFGFVPDASFPAVVGEKGRIHVQLTKTAAVSGFSAFNSGEQVNSVPDLATMKVDVPLQQVMQEAGVALTAPGTMQEVGAPAHGSKPADGINAGLKLLGRLPEAAQTAEIKQLLGMDTPDMFGENLGLAAPDPNFVNTSLNPGVIRYQNGQWHVELDIRFGRNLSCAQAFNKVQAWFDGWKATLVNQKPVHVVPVTPRIQKMIDIYHRHFPEEATTPIHMGGGTYASYFPGMIAYGPKIESIHTRGHRADECLQIDILTKTLAVYREALYMLIEEEQ